MSTPRPPAAVEDVLAHLEAFAPDDPVDLVLRSRFLEVAARGLTRTGEGPLSRRHFVPGHFTASAFVVSEDRACLLLRFHPKLGLWLQPGGHFEPEDRGLVQAARRELEEETSITDAALEDELFAIDLHTIPPIGSEPAHEHLDLRVLFSARLGAFPVAPECPAPAPSAEPIVWVPLARLGEAASGSGTDESVIRVARRLCHRYRAGSMG